jgi:hypothetical protein
MRKPLIVLLGLGVLVGYGSALGSMRHRWHHGYGQGDCGSRWGQRYEETARPIVTAPAPAPAPAPAAPAPQQQLVPQIIIVQPQAVPAAQAPTVIVQPPAAAPAAPTAPAALAAPAEKVEQTQAKAKAEE